MARPGSLALLLALALPLTPALSAQTPAPAPLVFHAETSLVLVDAIVTDKNGNAVRNLDKSHFHIYDDGKEQPLAGFDEHTPPLAPPREATEALAARLAALPPHTYTNIPLYPESTAVNVLLLDGLNTPMANQQEAHRQMIDYMGHIAPGTSLAIFTLSSRLRMVSGFTTDAASLVRLFKGKSGIAAPSPVLNQGSDSPQNDVQTQLNSMVDASSGSGPSAETVSALQQFASDLSAEQLDLRVHITLDAFQQLARYLSAIPGRKNLIWFSGSFPITLDPDPEQPLPFMNVRNYANEMRATADLLATARVALYPVDARGLMGASTTDAAYAPSALRVTANSGGKVQTHGSYMNDSNVVHDYDAMMTQNLAEHGSMQQIAAETGGIAAVNTNDLKEAVAKAVENGSNYYTLAFTPPDKKANGHYHRLKVAVDGGYKLSYRTGYFAGTNEKLNGKNSSAATLVAAATLHGAPPASQILFRTQVLPASDPALAGVHFQDGPAGDMANKLKGPTTRYIVGLQIDAHGIQLSDQPGGLRQSELELIVIAYDADGNKLNFVDRSFAFNIRPEDYQQRMESGFHGRLALDVPSGKATLRIVVQDINSARAGAIEVPVNSAK
ncbi:MAG: VWA domain-containing protein [Terracidiphilus sp.]|nr:VWA domain-containing protein [Terracidiphilus sp.]